MVIKSRRRFSDRYLLRDFSAPDFFFLLIRNIFGNILKGAIQNRTKFIKCVSGYGHICLQTLDGSMAHSMLKAQCVRRNILSRHRPPQWFIDNHNAALLYNTFIDVSHLWPFCAGIPCFSLFGRWFLLIHRHFPVHTRSSCGKTESYFPAFPYAPPNPASVPEGPPGAR